jgi:hypothetical protein
MHIVNQQHNLDLEMAAIQQMRLKLPDAFNAVPRKMVGTSRSRHEIMLLLAHGTTSSEAKTARSAKNLW